MDGRIKKSKIVDCWTNIQVKEPCVSKLKRIAIAFCYSFKAWKRSFKNKRSCQGCGTICETTDFLGQELPKRAKEQEKRGAKLKQALCAAGVNLATFGMFAMFALFKARKMFGIFAMFAGRVILATFAAWVIFAVIARLPQGELFGTIEPDAQRVGFWFSGDGFCFMWADLLVSLWQLPCAFLLPALRVLLMFFSGLLAFSELNFQVVRAARDQF